MISSIWSVSGSPLFLRLKKKILFVPTYPIVGGFLLLHMMDQCSIASTRWSERWFCWAVHYRYDLITILKTNYFVLIGCNYSQSIDTYFHVYWGLTTGNRSHGESRSSSPSEFLFIMHFYVFVDTFLCRQTRSVENRCSHDDFICFIQRSAIIDHYQWLMIIVESTVVGHSAYSYSAITVWWLCCSDIGTLSFINEIIKTHSLFIEKHSLFIEKHCEHILWFYLGHSMNFIGTMQFETGITHCWPVRIALLLGRLCILPVVCLRTMLWSKTNVKLARTFSVSSWSIRQHS